MQSSRTASIAGIAKRTNVRYLILLMIFTITTLNYADRATLSITGSAMRSEFGFDAIRMGYIFSAFSWAYVLSQLPAGWLLDRFGARRMYGASIFLWSLFTLLQSSIGLAGSAGAAVIALFVLRFAMGMAEAPAFPANAKVVASWFPTAERGTASAIFNSAQYFAAVIFTPLMAWITHSFGWQNVYLVMGVAGIVLALTWLKVMKNPSDHPRVNKAELEHIENGGGLIHPQRKTAYADAASPGTWFYVRQLMSNRMLLGVYLAQYCINVLTYFFLTWFPIYLVQARGMTILQAGLTASLPAICGFTGGVLGGVFSDALIRRGHSLTIARKVPIVGGMLLSVCIIGCNYVTADWLVVALMSLAFFGKGIGALGWAVVADTSPKEAIGLSGSIFNMFGNIAGIVTPIVIGYLVAKTGSFNGALVFVGINALLTVFSYLVIVKKIERVELRAPLVAGTNV
ncbi:MFS transporter [Caballeronia mineralivorans]|jgi:ACS family glucarate transporter-like MFS transporter/ACS family D-galactonate transporter-like MFS transporter|uniref:MFS transporter n=1 Tax=Caballeronia mineralivorans TaxID=2010198 RepID=UPI0023F2EDB6|nr:MFS transporter [Caballeronia mineralivorans]MDB5781412.1 D-galactonate transporter family protein [Caballeronia mineralivorans]MEA3103729.1 transporter, family, glucarate transporter [Caballeronia mineralivorans]